MGKSFKPFVVYDVHAYTRTAAIASEVIEDGFTVIKRAAIGYVHTIEIAEVQIPARWGRGTADPAVRAAQLKSVALREGATSEAIRQLRRVVPVSNEEEAIMAEKLKAKGGAKKTADKAGLKEAAKKAPVARGAKPGQTGTKPRGTRKPAERKPDTRKIKALVKAKDLTAREGTFRRKMLEDLIASKTVEEWRQKDAKYTPDCLKFAVDSNIVSVG